MEDGSSRSGGGGGGGAAAAAAGGSTANELPFGDPSPRTKLCAYCKKPGAKLKCDACLHRSYCDRKCQKKDWKKQHRDQCKKLQQVFVPPPPGWMEAAAEAEDAAK